jgi:peptidoglycan/xylan/chitin deacetylase (PgdA/CDA1 family)
MGVTDNPCEKASHTRRARRLSLTAWVAAAVTACVPAGCSSWSVATVAGTWETSRPERPLVLPRRTPQREIVVPILMYHRIGVPSPGAPSMTRRLTVHPADFARQMRWLKRNGYRTVTQRELFEALFRGRRLGRKPIVITFDDGYSDVLHRASPVLVRFGMRATAYVISGRTTNGDRVFLTWRQLHALERRGIEIGSHTVTHADLTSLSDREALRELVQSRRALERRLGHPVQWLAYPFGAYDGRTERLVRRAGYVLAVTTQYGVVQPARRPLALGRLRVLDSTGVAGLVAMLGAR